MDAPNSTRLILLLLGSGLGTGCGGATSPTPPPPPPAPGPPATVAIQSGDGQEGTPGGILALKPSVRVTDAAGRAVASVAVTFSVDSGGGAIAGAQATTGTDGVAAAGDWSLGRAEGRNTLLAQAGTISVRFSATGKLPTVDLLTEVVAPSGGSVTVSRAGDPLDGLRLDVPNAAFGAPVTLTIRSSSSLGIVLPALASLTATPAANPGAAAPGTPPSTPVISIVSNGPAGTAGPLTLRIPVPAGTANPIVAVVDAAGRIVAFLPAIGSGAGFLIVTTRALSTELLQQVGKVPQPLSSGPRTLSIVVFAGPQSPNNTPVPIGVVLPTPIEAPFLFGRNDFAFTDGWTAYFTPKRRNDVGMVLVEFAGLSLYPSGFYHALDDAPGVTASDSRGIRVAAGLTEDFIRELGPNAASWIVNRRGTGTSASQYDRGVVSAVVYQLAITGKPAPLLLSDGLFTRMVLVLGWNPTTESLIVRDPRLHGKTTLSFANGVMAPYRDPDQLTDYTSSYYDYTFLASFWSDLAREVKNATSSVDARPYELGWAIWRYETWQDVIIRTETRTAPDTLFVLGDSTRIWPIVRDAPWGLPAPGQPPAGWTLHGADFYLQGPGTTWSPSPILTGRTIFFDMSHYPQGFAETLGINAWRREGFNDNPHAWMGWKELRIIKYALRITAPGGKPTGEPITFTPVLATTGPQPPANAIYHWDFDDFTSPTETVGPAPVTHTFTVSGPRIVKLTVFRNGEVRPVAAAEHVRPVLNFEAWRIDSIKVQSAGGAAPIDAAGQQGFQMVQGWVNALLASPERGSLFLFQQPTLFGATPFQGLWLVVNPGAGTLPVFDPMLPEQYAKLASNAAGGIVGFLNEYSLSGTTSLGIIAGQGPLFKLTGTVGGRVNAAFSQNAFAGTMDLILLWFGGTRYTFSLRFWATRM